MERIPVKCPGAHEKFDGKTVVFQTTVDGEVRRLKGVFQVLPDPSSDSVFVDIEYKGLLARFEPPNTFGYGFHLAQSHLDSVVPALRPEFGDDWEVQLPLLFHHPRASSKSHPSEQ